MEDNDVQLQQKKRARRRLIGAIFFVSVVALVLPMIMDQEPRQQVQDVEIRIPGQDDKPFTPRLAEAPAELPATKQADSALAEKAAPEPQPATEPVKPLAPVVPNVKVAEVVRDKSPDDKAAEKVAEKPSPKPEKSADKKPVAEKKKDEAKSEKPSVKVAEKNEKPKAEDAKRAASILAGTAEESRAAGKGEYLILIGAFANEGNVKVLKGKLGELGIRTFTEQLVTADGKKIRVRAGPFPSRDAADKALARMKGVGVSGVVAAK